MSIQRDVVVRPIETTLKNKPFGDDDDDDEPLSPVGRLFHKEDFNVHILSVMGFKTKIDPAMAKADFPHTLLKHPRFSSLLVADGQNGSEIIMKWVRTEVNLDSHIIVPDIDTTEVSRGSADKFVEDYIYNLTKTRLDTRKPLWEFHVLNVETSMSKSVGIFMFHHCLGDGISLMSLLLACTRKTSDPNALPTIPTVKTADQTASTARGRLWNVFLGFWWGCKMFRNTVAGLTMFVATVFFALKDSKTPVNGPPSSDHSSPRRVVFGFVSLDDVKLVKNAMKTTINDVALGITQAGLSRYLNRRYGVEKKNNKGDTQKENNIPKRIRLRSMLFINIRPSPGLQDLADMMEKNTKAKWGNSLGFVILPFTIGLRDDPLDYVREAKATIDRKKHSQEAQCTFFIAQLIYKIFGLQYASSLFRRLSTNTTMAFSNVVGPIEEVNFFGHPMAFLAATTYGQALNDLMVNFQSYANKMAIVLSVCDNTILDPNQLRDDIVESLNIIKQTVIQKRISS